MEVFIIKKIRDNMFFRETNVIEFDNIFCENNIIFEIFYDCLTGKSECSV